VTPLLSGDHPRLAPSFPRLDLPRVTSSLGTHTRSLPEGRESLFSVKRGDRVLQPSVLLVGWILTAGELSWSHQRVQRLS
jgi:hypothetical protein